MCGARSQHTLVSVFSLPGSNKDKTKKSGEKKGGERKLIGLEDMKLIGRGSYLFHLNYLDQRRIHVSFG